MNFRVEKQGPTFYTILNMGTETEIVHMHHSIPNLPPLVTVVASSVNAGYQIGYVFILISYLKINTVTPNHPNPDYLNSCLFGY